MQTFKTIKFSSLLNTTYSCGQFVRYISGEWMSPNVKNVSWWICKITTKFSVPLWNVTACWSCSIILLASAWVQSWTHLRSTFNNSILESTRSRNLSNWCVSVFVHLTVSYGRYCTLQISFVLICSRFSSDERTGAKTSIVHGSITQRVSVRLHENSGSVKYDVVLTYNVSVVCQLYQPRLDSFLRSHNRCSEFAMIFVQFNMK